MKLCGEGRRSAVAAHVVVVVGDESAARDGCYWKDLSFWVFSGSLQFWLRRLLHTMMCLGPEKGLGVRMHTQVPVNLNEEIAQASMAKGKTRSELDFQAPSITFYLYSICSQAEFMPSMG